MATVTVLIREVAATWSSRDYQRKVKLLKPTISLKTSFVLIKELTAYLKVSFAVIFC